jgi:hypothetical protein
MNDSNWNADYKATSAEQPIGWRCHWLVTKGYQPFGEIKPKPGHRDYPTRELAEKHKSNLIAHFGQDGVIAHVTPVHVTSARRERDNAARQCNLYDTGWPIQMRPPRLGLPAKGRRRK